MTAFQPGANIFEERDLSAEGVVYLAEHRIQKIIEQLKGIRVDIDSDTQGQITKIINGVQASLDMHMSIDPNSIPVSAYLVRELEKLGIGLQQS